MIDDYQLVTFEIKHIPVLYSWYAGEKEPECYTCRPVSPVMPLTKYKSHVLEAVKNHEQYVYLLIKKTRPAEPLGKIVLFDMNKRNHSAEFGYYLPEVNRNRGLGSILTGLFLETVFSDEALDLNKIYATTSSINIPSISLLEKYRFQMDGRMREHYWINDEKYDQLIYSLTADEFLRGKQN
ncbi:MAG: GNAT family N-acetyltransferase [Clostridia bacterium]|nr:GNAT family N-acetyltransferase [Clostridia bacterium]